VPQEQPKASRWQVPIPVFFMLFAIIGALPWMAEKLSSPRYANQSPAYLEGQIGSISGAPAGDEIQTFIAQPEAFMQAGRVLYPRFFSRGRGLSSSNPWPAYQPRDYPRLGFLLLNQQLTYAIFPSREIPAPFPHAGDAIVLGCRHEDYVEVRMIAFPALDAALTSTPLSEPCSP
jgi:hypothetical protein